MSEQGLMYRREVQEDGLVRTEAVSVQRLPEAIDVVGTPSSIAKADGDVSVTATGFVLIDGSVLEITLPTPMRVLFSVIAYGKAAANEDMRLTVFLNQFNVGGDGGLSITECEHCGCLNFVVITDELPTGLHRFDLRAKVSGGTGTIYASLAKVPLTMGAVCLKGTV
jgi:hypothetical protein